MLSKGEKKFLSEIEITNKKGQKLSEKQLYSIANKLEITNKTRIKELYELALYLQAKSTVNEKQSNSDTLYTLEEQYQKQTTIKYRTSTSSLLGQFSTPLPIGYILGAWLLADKKKNYKAFEPFAGNGFMTIALDPRKTDVNEIDKNRLDSLKYIGYNEIMNFDASHRFPEKLHKKFDYVITNPPFFKKGNEAVNFDKYKVKNFDKKLALFSLETMKDNGRATIIIDGSPIDINETTFWTDGLYKKGENRNFFMYLYKNYNVVDVLYLNGQKMYSKQGTAINVRVLLIDGRKKNTKAIPPLYNKDYDKLTNSFTDLYDKMLDIKKDSISDKKEQIIKKYSDLLGKERLNLFYDISKKNTSEIKELLKKQTKSAKEYFDSLSNWIDNKNYIKLEKLLHKDNRNSIKFFNEYTGVILPKTNSKIINVLRKFAKDDYVRVKQEQQQQDKKEKEQKELLKQQEKETKAKKYPLIDFTKLNAMSEGRLMAFLERQRNYPIEKNLRSFENTEFSYKYISKTLYDRYRNEREKPLIKYRVSLKNNTHFYEIPKTLYNSLKLPTSREEAEANISDKKATEKLPTLIELLIKYLRADKKKLTFGVTEYINDVIEIGKIIGLNRTEEDVYEKRSLEIDFLQEAERNIGKKIKFDASRGIMSAITEATLIDITSQYVKFQKKRNNPKKFKYRNIRYLIKYNKFEFIDSKINGIDNTGLQGLKKAETKMTTIDVPKKYLALLKSYSNIFPFFDSVAIKNNTVITTDCISYFEFKINKPIVEDRMFSFENGVLCNDLYLHRNPSDMLDIPFLDVEKRETKIFEIDVKTLKEVIDDAILFTFLDELWIVREGIHIYSKENNLVVESTNGTTVLFRKTITNVVIANKFNLIIRDVKRLKKFLYAEKKGNNIEVFKYESKPKEYDDGISIGFVTKMSKFEVCNIDGEFPCIDKVIPTETTSTLSFSYNEIKNILKTNTHTDIGFIVNSLLQHEINIRNSKDEDDFYTENLKYKQRKITKDYKNEKSFILFSSTPESINSKDYIFINNNNLTNALKVLKKENVTIVIDSERNNAIIELDDSKTIPTKKKQTDTKLIELLIKYLRADKKEDNTVRKYVNELVNLYNKAEKGQYEYDYQNYVVMKLAGRKNRDMRIALLEELTGKKVLKSKSGIGILKSEIKKLSEQGLQGLKKAETKITVDSLNNILCEWLVLDEKQNYKVFEPFADKGSMTTLLEKNHTDINVIDKNKLSKFKNKGYNEITNFDASNGFHTIKRPKESMIFDKEEESVGIKRLKKYDYVMSNLTSFNDIKEPTIFIQIGRYFEAGDPENEKGLLKQFKITDFDKKLALYSLNTMKDSGKAVIIIKGSESSLNKNSFWKKQGYFKKQLYKKGEECNFFTYLYNNYNVADVLYLDGKEIYNNKGSVRVLLIDGRKEKPNQKDIPPPYNKYYDRVISSHEELHSLLLKNFFWKQTKNKAINLMTRLVQDENISNDDGWNRGGDSSYVYKGLRHFTALHYFQIEQKNTFVVYASFLIEVLGRKLTEKEVCKITKAKKSYNIEDMQSGEPFVEFFQTDLIPALTLVYMSQVAEAILKGFYTKLIVENKITTSKVIEIIESANLPIPKNILDMKKDSISDKKTNNKMKKQTDTKLIELLIKYFKYENKEVKGIEINHNKAKNGIEIKFNNKPSEEIRNFLKSKKFRWSRINKVWYAKYNNSLISEISNYLNTAKIHESSEEKSTSIIKKLDFEKLHSNSKKPRKDVIIREIQAGKMEVAIHRRWNRQQDTNDYFEVNNDSFSPAEKEDDLIVQLERAKGNSHWINSATIDKSDKSDKLGYYIYFSDYYIRYKSSLNGLAGEYFPTSQGSSFDVEVPDNMDTETHEFLAKINEKVGGIDAFVKQKLRYETMDELYASFKAEQIDALAIAIYNIEIKGTGLILGFQTGIGKGRVLSGILRYAKYCGKKPIFVTLKENLFTDIYRDMQGIGLDDLTPIASPEKDENGEVVERYKNVTDKDTGEIYQVITEPKYIDKKRVSYKGKRQFKPFILNAKSKIKDAKGNIIYQSPSANEIKKKLKNSNLKGYDCVLATYSQFNLSEEKAKKEGKVIAKNIWLRELATNNIVLLDESHTAGGDSNTGKFFRQIVSLAKGVCYSSGTYAKTSKNMPIYYSKTAIRDTMLGEKKFVEAIIRGGNALQEVVSANLVESGNYIRLERPLSGIDFNFITFDEQGNDKFGVKNKRIEHKELFNQVVEVLRNVFVFQKEHVEPFVKDLDEEAKKNYKRKSQNDTAKLGFKRSPAFSRLFNIVNQIVFSLKADDVADRAIQHLKNGVKPVIVFQNTFESFLDDLVAKYGKNVPTDYSIVLKIGLEKSMQYTEYDEDGKPKPKQVHFVGINQLSKEAQKLYDEIIDAIHTLAVDINISPIDRITARIKKAGYSVGEITGRKIFIEQTSKNKGVVRNRRKQSPTDIARDFNNNDTDVVMLNMSGSTGISLHAFEPYDGFGKKNVKPRAMLVAQPPLDINEFAQMLGRINRSGQLYPPSYDILSLSVPAEKRLMTMLQRKLRSLDSNTSSNQQENENVINVPDFFNKYGDALVDDWLQENDTIKETLDNPNYVKGEKDKETGEYELIHDIDNCAYKTSGRIAILPVETQEDFYNVIMERYIDVIQALIRNDEYDLEVLNVNLDAKIIYSNVFMPGLKKGNPFSEDSIIEECDVKVLAKPYTKKELDNIISKKIVGTTAEEYQQKFIEKYQGYVGNSKNQNIKSINELFDKKIKQITEKPSIKRILKEEGKQAWKLAIEQKQNSLSLDRNDRINKVNESFEVSNNWLLGVFQIFKIGDGYIYPTGESTLIEGKKVNVVAKAVFIGFEIKENSNNPYAPSGIKCKFAISNSAKSIDFVLSEKDRLHLHKVMSANEFKSNYEKKDIFNNWDFHCKDSMADRETRFLITGNILQAYEHVTGKLINCVYGDGAVRKAILTHKDFKPSSFKEVAIIQAKKLFENLSEGSFLSSDTQTTDKTIEDGVKITKKNNFYYKIEVPSSAKKGAIYYKNPDLINLTELKDFEKEEDGKRWHANIHKDNLTELLQILSDLGVKLKLNSSQYEFIRTDIETKTTSNNTDDYNFIDMLIKYNKFNKQTGQPKKQRAVAGLGRVNKSNINFDKIL